MISPANDPPYGYTPNTNVCPYCGRFINNQHPMTESILICENDYKFIKLANAEVKSRANPNCRHCLGRGVQKWVLPNGEKKTIECKCVKRSLT